MTRRRIVCLSSLPWHGRPTSRHHIAHHLAVDHDVLFVDPPVNLLRTGRAHRGRLIEEDRMVRLEPPPHLPFGDGIREATFTWLNQRRYAAAVRRAVDSLGWIAPTLWTVFPIYSATRVAEYLPTEAHVLHMTDSLWDLEQYTPRYERFLDRLRTTVDVALGSTPAIVERLGDYGWPVHELEHGVDVERFEPAVRAELDPPAELLALAHPRVGFVGRLDHRLDVDVVVDLARTASVVLIGPVDLPAADERRLRDAGCHLVGEVPYDDLPRWMGGLDIGLVPYRPTGFVRASRPLKLLDYLAAGLPVLSVDIPAARSLAPHVRVATGAEGFRSELGRLWADEQASEPRTARLERVAAVADRSWREIAARLLEVFDEAARRRRDGASRLG